MLSRLKIHIGIVLFCCIVILSSCTKKAKDELINRDKIVVAVNEYSNNNFNETEEQKIVELLSRELNVEYELVFVDDQQKVIDLLRERKADIAIGCLSANMSLFQEFDFSFFYDTKSFYCITKDISFHGIVSLIEGKRLCFSKMIPKDIVDSLIQNDKQAPLITDNIEEICSGIDDNSIECYICYKEMAFDMLYNKNDLNVYKIEDLSPTELVVLVNKNDVSILTCVNDVVEEYKRNYDQDN